MEKKFSIVYAHRNKDAKRIKYSLESLKHQSLKNFEVVFVDYGSENILIRELEILFTGYNFLNFYKLPVSHLLWNKSKALNYGINQATTSYIFIADIDLIFHPEATIKFEEIAGMNSYHLFKLGYLEKSETKKLEKSFAFEDLNISRIGNVNGMVLAPIKAFFKINGLDEFFHFYGAEDEDLFQRLQNAGFFKMEVEGLYFYHNWHPSFSSVVDNVLTINPRVKNIMRINQQHFLRNRESGVIKPLRQYGMGENLFKKKSELFNPSKSYAVCNILAKVEHFLSEELPSLKGEIVEAEFSEDPYYRTIKYRVKKLIGKQNQTYCSLKDVNDMVLKEIIFRYRDHNYFFKVSADLKTILFRIKL